MAKLRAQKRQAQLENELRPVKRRRGSILEYPFEVMATNRQRNRPGYAVKPPVSGGIVTRYKAPRINTVGQRTIVSNTEISVSISQAAAGAFNTTGIPLIPSQFSWLSNVADLYSKFRWVSLELIYVPKCPTTTQGMIAMALTYDRNDAGPASRAAVAQCYRAISFPPYAGYDGAAYLNSDSGKESAIAVKLDVDRLDKLWYPTIAVAAFNALPAVEQNYFCPGSWTQGNDSGAAVGVNMGDIFVKYVCEFIEPINPTMNA